MKSFGKVKYRRYAFTLAEVLITITVIGVVAALTIPNLVNNYQNKAWNTASQVFEKKLEDSLQVMNSQGTLAGYSSTEDFVNELSKHIKITKICKNENLTECFEDNIVWEVTNIDTGGTDVSMKEMKTASDLGKSDWGTEAVGLQFVNGVSGIIAYNPTCVQDPYSNQVNPTSCISLIYDTSGFKSPNTYSKDVRAINSFFKDCAFRDSTTCFSEPFVPEWINESQCRELIAQNYGLLTCPTYNGHRDYYAGAVKKCGGTNKMASAEHLAKIANYVYNTSGIEAMQNSETVTLDYDKVSKLGFSTTSSSAFLVWAGDTSADLRTPYRLFTPNKSYWSWNYGSGPTYQIVQAVCIIN